MHTHISAFLTHLADYQSAPVLQGPDFISRTERAADALIHLADTLRHACSAAKAPAHRIALLELLSIVANNLPAPGLTDYINATAGNLLTRSRALSHSERVRLAILTDTGDIPYVTLRYDGPLTTLSDLLALLLTTAYYGAPLPESRHSEAIALLDKLVVAARAEGPAESINPRTATARAEGPAESINPRTATARAEGSAAIALAIAAPLLLAARPTLAPHLSPLTTIPGLTAYLAATTLIHDLTTAA